VRGAISPRLPLDTPGATRERFVTALNAGDIPSATDCFASDGGLIVLGATKIHGHKAIARALAQISECPGEIEVVLSEVERAGELELASERWGMRLRREEEEASMSELRATMMLHRFEGSWKLSIVVLDSEDLTGAR